jgi:hypothetical protein
MAVFYERQQEAADIHRQSHKEKLFVIYLKTMQFNDAFVRKYPPERAGANIGLFVCLFSCRYAGG